MEKSVKKKEIKIDLLPEDFIGNIFEEGNKCPLYQAIKRKYKDKEVSVGSFDVSIKDPSHIVVFFWRNPNYRIKNGFCKEDYEYVKQQYSKKNCNTIYQVTLIPV